MLSLDIKKEPDYFSAYIKKHNAKRYQDDCNDGEFRKQLRKSLLQEQNHQCFYCEQKIVYHTKKIHIDHICQRNHFPTLECKYINMVLSCNGKGEKYCGKYKDKRGKWDNNKYIDLNNDNPKNIFIFSSNGKVKANNDLSQAIKQKAENTINYLNLNHNDLIGARKKIFLQLLSYKNQNLSIKEIYNEYKEFESIFQQKGELT